MTRHIRLAQKIYADKSKLNPADLLSNEDYDRERSLLLGIGAEHRRQRRLRLNPDLSLVFETRFTAWLQIQEELRWLAHPSEHDIEEVLRRLNLLITEQDQLAATLLIDGGNKPSSAYWIECVAANAFSIALRLSGRVLRGQSPEPSTGALAAVHTLIFKPTDVCGPVSEVVWGDSAALYATPLSAISRYTLTRDLSPDISSSGFVAPSSGTAVRSGPTHPAVGLGQPSLPHQHPPLREVSASKPKGNAESP